jgi:hypothetical protein
MATRTRSTVVGVFPTRDQGHYAVEELRRAGFPDSHITMVVAHHPRPGEVDVTDMDAAKAAQVSGQTKEAEGAVIGAVAGGVGGAALALAASFLPGVGPVLSLGMLAATLFGVTAGAAGGGIVGALVGLDFPEEEARFYERELKAGRALVGVKADGRLDEARAVLQRCGGYDATSPLATAEPAAEFHPASAEH